MNRVAITGLGVISPVGQDIETVYANLRDGVCGVGRITRFDPSETKISVAAEVKDFDPEAFGISRGDTRRMDLFTQYAMAAAQQAVDDSGIVGAVAPERLGVYVGSGIGGMNTFMAECKKLFDRGPSRISPLFIPMMIGNIAAGNIAIRYGCKGPSLPVVTACATSTNTIGEAFHAIRYGYADAILAGGSEATVNPLAIGGFANCKALTEATDPEAASLPFDRRRAGFVLGEGAAVVVLENYDHAVARGDQIPRLRRPIGFRNGQRLHGLHPQAHALKAHAHEAAFLRGGCQLLFQQRGIHRPPRHAGLYAQLRYTRAKLCLERRIAAAEIHVNDPYS